MLYPNIAGISHYDIRMRQVALRGISVLSRVQYTRKVLLNLDAILVMQQSMELARNARFHDGAYLLDLLVLCLHGLSTPLGPVSVGHRKGYHTLRRELPRDIPDPLYSHPSALPAARVDIPNYPVKLGVLSAIKVSPLIDSLMNAREVFQSSETFSSEPSLPLVLVAAASLLPGSVKQPAHSRILTTSLRNDLEFSTDPLDQSLCTQISGLQLFTRSRLDNMGYPARVKLSIVTAQGLTRYAGSHRLLGPEGANIHQFGAVFDHQSYLLADLQVRIAFLTLLCAHARIESISGRRYNHCPYTLPLWDLGKHRMLAACTFGGGRPW